MKKIVHYALIAVVVYLVAYGLWQLVFNSGNGLASNQNKS